MAELLPVEVELFHSVVKDLQGARIRELSGRECISQLFYFDLHVVTNGPLDPNKLILGDAALHFGRRSDSKAPLQTQRYVSGVLSSVRDRLVGRGGHYEYFMQFVPKLWHATLTVATDVFLELTVPKIIEKVLEVAGLEPNTDFALELEGTYPAREFVVQQNESHYDFIARLCEHLGIAFSFVWDEEKKKTKVVFSDSNEAFADANPKEAYFQPKGERTDLYALETTIQQITKQHNVRDYNYRIGAGEVAAQSTPLDNAKHGEHNEYGGHFKTGDEAKQLALVRAQQEATGYQVYVGGCDYAGFAAGSKTKVEHHPREIGELLITEVNHHLVTVTHGFGATGETPYENEFRAIPVATVYRPPRITRKPKIAGLVTALVEHPGEKKVGAVDEHGLYRVNLHQDSMLTTADKPGGERKREDGKKSKPIRMAQPNAGLGRKFHYPLADRSEVVLGFVNGDPDRPIILGAVPTLAKGKGVRESAVVQDNNRKVILKTNETELSIDDNPGKSQWRVQCDDWAHVFLMGANEGVDKQDRTKAHIREDGFSLASIKNYTATVNEGMTFESKLRTSLQQTKTSLTADKVVEYVGEDPGWEDWKNFDEALAKAEAYKRFVFKGAAEAAQKQGKIDWAKSEQAKKDHAKAKKEATDAAGTDDLDKAREDNDKASKEANDEAEKACAEAEQKQKELDELEKEHTDKQAAERKADADYKAADGERRACEGRVEQARKRYAAAPRAEKPAAQAEGREAVQDVKRAEGKVQNVKAAQDQAKSELDAVEQKIEAKKAEVETARTKCQEAKTKKADEQGKKKALANEKKAAKKKDRTAKKTKKNLEEWKRLENKAKAGGASEDEKAGEEKKAKAPEKKDLWSKIAKDLSDEAHKQHLEDTKKALEDAAGSLEASTEREAADAGAFVEPYWIRVSKDSAGIVAHKNAFIYGDDHATVYSHKHAHQVSQDQAHVKADKGVEIATDDWIKITSTKTIDLQCDKEIQLVADSDENKAMPGGHTMLFYSHKGINMESATGKIEGKAMKSIELTASTTGIKLTADLANIQFTASAGMLKGTGTAGVMLDSPAMVKTSAGGMAMHTAGGMMVIDAGGMINLSAKGLGNFVVGGILTCGSGAASTYGAGMVATLIGGAGAVLA